MAVTATEADMADRRDMEDRAAIRMAEATGGWVDMVAVSTAVDRQIAAEEVMDRLTEAEKERLGRMGRRVLMAVAMDHRPATREEIQAAIAAHRATLQARTAVADRRDRVARTAAIAVLAISAAVAILAALGAL